jgi:SAM-dependent methyltransferase
VPRNLGQHIISISGSNTCVNFGVMKLNPQDLQAISERTLENYDQRAADFWEGTRDHDVSQNIAALLRYIEAQPPFAILDVGCGPGRDLKTFTGLGHATIGLEGAPRFAAMARAHSGCEVWQQDLLKLDLPDNRFDGIFANAVLFHVPSRELARVLKELHATLNPPACSSARTRAATTKKAGTADATARITTSKHGAVT